MNQYNSFNFKNFKYFFLSLLFLFLIFLTIGIPVVSWGGFFIVCLAVVIVITGKLFLNLKKLTIAIIVAAISLTLQISFPKNIQEGFIIYPTEKNDFLEKNLPNEVNSYLRDIIKKNYPIYIPSLTNSWSFSADGFWQKKSMSRLTNDINFESIHELRIGAFNDASMQIGHGHSIQIDHNNWTSYSLRLPLVLKYILPDKFSDADLCFEGLVYINNRFLNNEKNDCIKLNEESLEIFAFDLDPLPNLKMKIISNDIVFKFEKFKIFIQIFLALIIVFLFGTISTTSILYILFGIMNYFIYLYDIIFNEYLPTRFSTFVYMARGNDGLNHYGYGREILRYLNEGNLFMAIRGGEDIFQYMPGLRYFHALWMIFFGETILGYILIGILLPFLILKLLRNFFSKKTSLVLVWFFLIFPIFESFGFLHFYYMKLIAKGFGGTVGWTALFAAICLFLNNNSISKKENFISGFSAGILLVIAISCRPNVLPTAIILITDFCFMYLINNNKYKLIGVILGSINFFWFTIHNFYYGKKFFLILYGATVERNMPVSPDMWATFLSELFSGHINYILLNTLLNHISIWINYYEIWLILCIITLILNVFHKKVAIETRIISLSLLFTHSAFIFYQGVPRYTYGLWVLSLIMMLVFVKNNTNILLMLKNIKKIKF